MRQYQILSKTEKWDLQFTISQGAKTPQDQSERT